MVGSRGDGATPLRSVCASSQLQLQVFGSPDCAHRLILGRRHRCNGLQTRKDDSAATAKVQRTRRLPNKRPSLTPPESPRASSTRRINNCASSLHATPRPRTGITQLRYCTRARNRFCKQVRAAQAATYASSFSMSSTRAR
jgi:hypothetical protein